MCVEYTIIPPIPLDLRSFGKRLYPVIMSSLSDQDSFNQVSVRAKMWIDCFSSISLIWLSISKIAASSVVSKKGYSSLSKLQMARLNVAIEFEVEVRASLLRRHLVFNINFFLTVWIIKEHENLAALATGTLYEISKSLYRRASFIQKIVNWTYIVLKY